MNDEFLALPVQGVSDANVSPLILSAGRKRQRKHRRARVVKDVTYQLKVRAFEESEEDLVPVGLARMREMLTIALRTMFGEAESHGRFRWEVVDFDAKTKVAHLRLSTADFVAFSGALALLPTEEGRLKIIGVMDS